MTDAVTQQVLAERAIALVQLADALGFTLTIETEACKPLALGHYDLKIEVRESHANYRSQS
ncbi:hypothetical protein [Polynucleobacter sp. UK-Kesae-W10]|uniref:hypothetical protein n=1 Tax=Polynucleobacter sp. UK-Kesae-W10 TaxID=1819738 RepID=UPI001C0C364D|nr:hypothetical protein [Polynucleobacter sp. UK-Kesae-W10]MBU3577534.1 hypothetical protein [Polynucleobacter sp. UK-Kesae-W10]